MGENVTGGEQQQVGAAQACRRDDDMDALVDWLRGAVQHVPYSEVRQLEKRRPGLLERFVLGDILAAREYEGMQSRNGAVGDASSDTPKSVIVRHRSEKRLSDY